MPKALQRAETDLYFGGSSGVGGIQPSLPSLAREYNPLDNMDANTRRQVFGMWLGIVCLNGTEDYEYRRDVPAEEDPLLVLRFRKEYEAGAWRKLSRGMTLQELALTFEFSRGQGFMALVSANGPATKTPRLTRKLMLDADARGAQFAYHDPWPGNSLLCAEHNTAGVAAASLGNTKIHFGADKSVEIPVWGVTREELARVLVATFVMLPDWSGLMLGMISGAFSPRLRLQLKAALAAQADAAEKMKTGK